MDEPRTHELKTWPAYFQAVWDGEKTFEIRKDDRNYQVGDFLILQEWSPEVGRYTGREIRKRVTYVTNFAQQFGYVVMAIAIPLPEHS